MKNRVKIIVDGKSFTLVGEETEDHMREVATYVDAKMRQLRRDAISVRLDSSLAYALTSLNIADEYYKEKHCSAVLREEIAELMEQLEAITTELDMLKSERKTWEIAVASEVLTVPKELENLEDSEEIQKQDTSELADITAEKPSRVECVKSMPMAKKGQETRQKQYRKKTKPQYGRK